MSDKRWKVTTTVEPWPGKVLVYHRGAIVECVKMGKGWAYPWSVRRFEFEALKMEIATTRKS